MINWLVPACVGALTGVLSGFGIGGGTLLLIYLTVVVDMEQTLAQSINLLYFLPAAATALPSHIKNGYINKRIATPAVLAGLVCTAIAAWTATTLDVDLLRKCFGIFLLYIGITELFRKNKIEQQDHR